MKIEVKRPEKDEVSRLKVEDWPVWTCEVSEFPWRYDEKETCYILEGEVEVKTGGEVVKFGKGDLVIFPKGLECEWKVIKPVRKHYRFG